MNRVLGGGRLKIVRLLASNWTLAAVGVLVIAAVLLMAVRPVHAAAPASAKWLNRMYLVADDGTNYYDQNSYDTTAEFTEQSANPCPNKIDFNYTATAGRGQKATPDDNAMIYFYYNDTNYKGLWQPTLQVGTQITAGSGQQQCTYKSQSITINDIFNRRILFIKSDDGNTISNIPSGVTFARKGDWAGFARYFRTDETADTSNSCPDMIIEHPANTLTDGGDVIHGRGDIAGSAILFAVVKDNSLGRVSESYALDSQPNNITPTTCHVQGDAVNAAKGGPYNLASWNDNSLDADFLASGLLSNGATDPNGANFKDDAWIIFIGTTANLPKDVNNQPITTPPANNGDKINGQTCKGGALGWIVCPIVSLIQTLVDWLRDAMQKMLTVQPLPLDTTQPIYQIWGNIRNFANIAFVLVFFAVIFSQATSIGISNYGIKRILPRLILVAIGTNLSYYVCSFLVDAFNVLGVGVYNLIAIVNGGSSGTVNVSNGAGAILIGLAAAGTAAAFYTGAVVELFPLLVTAFLGFVVTFIVLFIRQALIIMLVIISPLAFVAALLPGTESWFRKWFETFTALLVMYPLLMLLFAGARLAGSILSAVGGGK